MRRAIGLERTDPALFRVARRHDRRRGRGRAQFIDDAGVGTRNDEQVIPVFATRLEPEPVARQPVPVPTAQAALAFLVKVVSVIKVVASSAFATPAAVSMTVLGLVLSFDIVSPASHPRKMDAAAWLFAQLRT